MEHLSYSLSHKLPPILLVLLLITNNLTIISSARPIGPELQDTTNTQFIKTSCGATSYPDLCFTTLACHAPEIRRSLKLLATVALSETLKTVRSASTAMSELSKDWQGDLTAREAEALSDCVEELKVSMEELHRSIQEMGADHKKNNGSNFGLRMSDIETWVSAALTDEDTCVDGFSENSMNGKRNGNENGNNTRVIKSTVRGHILNVAHMTSNALALVNYYALLHS